MLHHTCCIRQNAKCHFIFCSQLICRFCRFIYVQKKNIPRAIHLFLWKTYCMYKSCYLQQDRCIYLYWRASEEDYRSTCLSIFPLHSFLSLLPPENGRSSEWVRNQCPDTRIRLMRIRNILIKTHNPPLNPSLQNHLHSVVPLHAAAVTAHSGPLFYFASSLTQGYVSLCLPSVSVIFDPLSLDFHTRWAEGHENSAFVCTSTLSPVWNGKWDICLMRRRWTGTCRPTQR